MIDVRAIVGILGTGEYPLGGDGMQEWSSQANCNGLNVHAFFVDGRKPEASQAKRICMDCPVRWQCLEDGILEEYGIWGGLIRNERTHLLRLLQDNKPTEAYLEKVDRRSLLEYETNYGWPVEELRQRLARPEPPAERELPKNPRPRHLRIIRGGG